MRWKSLLALSLGATVGCSDSKIESAEIKTERAAQPLTLIQTSQCKIDWVRIDYDQPGTDAADFIELRVTSTGGLITNLTDCGVTTMWLYHSDSCLLPYAIVALANLSVPANGVVIIDPGHATISINIAGTAAEGWIHNQPSEIAVLPVNVLSLPLAWAAYEGTAKCAPLAFPSSQITTIQTETDAASNKTNVWCNGSFQVQDGATNGPGAALNCGSGGSGGVGGAGGAGGKSGGGAGGAAGASGGSTAAGGGGGTNGGTSGAAGKGGGGGSSGGFGIGGLLNLGGTLGGGGLLNLGGITLNLGGLLNIGGLFGTAGTGGSGTGGVQSGSGGTGVPTEAGSGGADGGVGASGGTAGSGGLGGGGSGTSGTTSSFGGATSGGATSGVGGLVGEGGDGATAGATTIGGTTSEPQGGGDGTTGGTTNSGGGTSRGGSGGQLSTAGKSGGGTNDNLEGGGCSCSTVGARPNTLWSSAVALGLALGWLRRRTQSTGGRS